MTAVRGMVLLAVLGLVGCSNQYPSHTGQESERVMVAPYLVRTIDHELGIACYHRLVSGGNLSCVTIQEARHDER